MSTEPHQPWRALVVDDEALARATIRSLLEDDPEVDLIGECSSGKEALAALEGNKIDLVFLDIQMPGMTGFELLDAIEERSRPYVVFVTAYDQFALKAFEVHALDYVLKPFDDERFQRTLERAKGQLRLDTAPQQEHIEDMLERVADGETEELESIHEAPLERLSIHREGRVEVVLTRDLRWIEAADQYVRLHTHTSEHLMRESMSRIARRLDTKVFIRIHRSAIVAFDAIKRLESLAGGSGRVLMEDEHWLPVSRSRMPTLRKLL
ncbi:MAG: two-component system LytT family response regulator [Planctomycetota bacterium]|jgi:two-component system LytT family response regulator